MLFLLWYLATSRKFQVLDTNCYQRLSLGNVAVSRIFYVLLQIKDKKAHLLMLRPGFFWLKLWQNN
jgi:hypothetical protein